MLKNLKFSFKMILGFSIVLILTGFVAFLGIRGLNDILNRAEKTNLINDLIKYSLSVGSTRREYIISGDNAQANLSLEDLDKLKKTAEELKGKFNNSENQQLMDNILTKADEYQKTFSEYIDLKKSSASLQQTQPAEYEKIKGQMNSKLQALSDDNNSIRTNCDKAFEIQKQKEESETAASEDFMLIGSAAAILFGILIALFITRSITKPVNVILSSLKESSEQVASASSQLSASSQQLAEGSSEQAASIEETSSTLEESSSMIKQNAENTKQAAILAGQTKAAADKGNAEMQDMMESMTEIKKSSDQIAKIIKVIDEIAFQTNILALNAAVEAARAGDAGMGFAVVAEEVRNLAQRSAQAAKDTAAIIESNIELSDKGVDVAKMVGESLADITLQAKKVNELMDEISAASQEQTQGIIQINKAIVQMEKVTQQIAANAEESASASEELNAQAESMQDVVGQLAQLVNGSSAQVHTITYADKNKTVFEKKDKLHTVPASNHHQSIAVRNEPGKTRVVKPEEVIPLEDDLKDF